jgi:methylated-DNA-[protein]-cysteine S-methyltransferase
MALLEVGYMESPVGLLRIQAGEMGVERIDFVEEISDEEMPGPLLFEARKQLRDYFAGERRVFQLPLHAVGTHFQMNVWDELIKIPFAKTLSYEDVARKLGDVKVIRAAASANGRNPLPIIIPCHRVIGKNGKLTGYSGGLSRKKWLLEFELKTVQAQLVF